MARQVSLRGKRFSALESPRSWRTTSIRSAASPRSSTLKDSVRPSRLTVLADQPVGDRVECPGPRQPYFLLHFGHDAARAARHLERGAARKGEQEEPLRRAALEHEMRNAVRQGVGLAGTGPGDDEERRSRRRTRPRAAAGSACRMRRSPPRPGTIDRRCTYIQYGGQKRSRPKTASRGKSHVQGREDEWLGGKPIVPAGRRIVCRPNRQFL